MIKYLSKFVFSLLFALGLAVPIMTSNAAELDVKSCSSDYYGFISSVRSENTRKQYFEDFFTLSYCQVNDIIEIYDEMDELRDTFRDDAFACENTSQDKKDYNRLLMEVYFIRSLQSTPVGVINDLDSEQLDALASTIIEQTYTEMYDIFVIEEERVDSDDFNNYFEEWTQEYSDKVVRYKSCDEGPWAELGGVWADFVNTIEEININIDKPEKRSLKDIVTPDVDKNATVNTGALGRCILTGFECFKKEADKRKLDNEPPKDEHTAESSNFGNVFDEINMSESGANIVNECDDRIAAYREIYGFGGSLNSSDMRGIVRELNRVIEETNTKDFPNIELDVAKVYDLQCN